MNNEELKGKQAADMSANAWMREICLQLVLLNEKQTVQPAQVADIPEKRGSDRPRKVKVN